MNGKIENPEPLHSIIHLPYQKQNQLKSLLDFLSNLRPSDLPKICKHGLAKPRWQRFSWFSKFHGCTGTFWNLGPVIPYGTTPPQSFPQEKGIAWGKHSEWLWFFGPSFSFQDSFRIYAPPPLERIPAKIEGLVKGFFATGIAQEGLIKAPNSPGQMGHISGFPPPAETSAPEGCSQDRPVML